MPILRFVMILHLAGLALAACGVRGDLEPPPGAAAVSEPDRSVVEAPVTRRPDLDILDDGQDAERVVHTPRRSIYPPASDSFVLDPLL